MTSPKQDERAILNSTVSQYKTLSKTSHTFMADYEDSTPQKSFFLKVN